MSEKNLSEHATQFSIGKLIPEDVTMVRDAIHIAVLPVTASCGLRPGQDIGLDGSGFAAPDRVAEKMLGIVDPFLKNPVEMNQKFFMFLYPNTITSLAHQWSHPDLPTKEQADFANLMQHGTTTPAAKLWLEEYAREHEISYNKLMNGARDFLASSHHRPSGEHVHLGTDISYEKTDEFWKNYEVVTGRKMKEDEKQTIFTCSC